jgi:hypothetical protein
MRKSIDDALAAHLARTGVSLTADERAHILRRLDEQLARGRRPTEVSIDVREAAETVAATTLRTIKEMRPESAQPPEGDSEFLEDLRREFVKARTAPPRLSVLVTSTEIREGASQDNVVRLRLKVTEEGVEWTTIERDGKRRDILVPE